MHSNTHPEPDERAAVREPRTLRDALVAARDQDGLSNVKLAQQIGYSPSVISQFINGEYPGDKEKLERRINDWIRNRERRRKQGVELIESDATKQVMSALEAIRRTNDVGVIYGDAGVGKTSGIVLYLQDNPTSLEITLNRWSRTDTAIERLVFQALDGASAWSGNTPRGEFIVEKLKGSSRLLIVDNAHKATKGGLEWLFDLHDETRIPVALVGNEEVLRPIEANDQRFSRIGLKQPVTPGRVRPLVKHLVNQIAPNFAGKGVEDLLEQVAEQHGRFRGVTKQVALASMLAESAGLEPAASVKAAHQRLVRHYALA